MYTDPSGKSFSEEIELSFSIFIKSQDPFVAVDYNFSLLYLNNAAEKLFCKKKGDLIGQPFENVFPKEWTSQAFRTVRKNVSERLLADVKYNSPATGHWVHVIGRPFENYYTLTYRTFDHKEMLKSELRQQVRRK